MGRVGGGGVGSGWREVGRRGKRNRLGLAGGARIPGDICQVFQILNGNPLCKTFLRKEANSNFAWCLQTEKFEEMKESHFFIKEYCGSL